MEDQPIRRWWEHRQVLGGASATTPGSGTVRRDRGVFGGLRRMVVVLRRSDSLPRAPVGRSGAPHAGPAQVDPVADLLAELSRLAGQVLAWGDQIAELVNGLGEIRYTATGAGTEQLRAEVALFERRWTAAPWCSD